MPSPALVPKRTTERRTDQTAEEVTEVKVTTESRQELLNATDALLDEIDEVLEVAEPQPQSLADLIRWGAKLNPQCIGNWTGQQGETCALQAALQGAQDRELI